MMKGQRKLTNKMGAPEDHKMKESQNNNGNKTNKTDILVSSTITKKIPKVKQSFGRRTKKYGLKQMDGSGECLLSRKSRGYVGGVVGETFILTY